MGIEQFFLPLDQINQYIYDELDRIEISAEVIEAADGSASELRL